MTKELEKKLEKLVNFLQDNTNIAEMIIGYGGNDEPIGNCPEGEYAAVERYLRQIDDTELEDYLIN